MYYLQKFLAKCESVQALYNEPGADYQTVGKTYPMVNSVF